MTRYDNQRPPKVAPHASLRGVRKATGLTLDQVADAVNDILGRNVDAGDPLVNRGTISAIESGTRGASTQMLNAIAVAYGMDPGDIVTDYAPRDRKPLAEAVGQ